MAFDRPTITEIKDRIENAIEARLFSNLALLRNAILRILARVFAGAIHGVYGYLDWISEQLFITTAETEFLNRHGRMWGISRRPGSFASGESTFYGTNGTTIPEETIVQSEDGIEYATTASGVISGGSVVIPIQAVEAGESGNLTNGSNLQLISPIANIEDNALSSAIIGGQDVETDELYRTRILQRIQTIPAGGSSADYVRWATEVSGVERAWCFPLSNGPGTVTTVITATGTNPTPSSALISEVEDYIEARRPVTASHDVRSVTDIDGNDGTVKVWIELNLIPAEQTDEIKSKISENLELLFAPHIPGMDIKISQLRAAITNAGVSDFEITFISLDYLNVLDLNADLPLSGYMYPTLDIIYFGDLL